MTATAPQPRRVGVVPPRSAVVELRDVFCVHRTAEGDAAALQGLTLDLVSGQLTCVVGPSGAGKTTLLRVIAGLQQPSAGGVRVFGRDLTRLNRRSRARFRHDHVGFLAQRAELTLPPDLPARDALALPLILRGAGRTECRRRVDELLEGVGLAERCRALPAELSGGERQRLALGCALAHRPRLLLADEPTGELDGATAVDVRGLIAKLSAEQGATAVIVTHDPQTAEQAARTLVLRDGRIVEDDGLAVARDGWVAVPPALLASAGIAERATVRLGDDGLVVAPGTGPGPAAENDRSGRSGSTPWQPSTVRLQTISQSRGGRLVLDRMDRHVVDARLTAVVGRSGAGKTTLLRLLAGLDRPDAGEVTVDGIELGRLDDEQRAAFRRERIGYLSQEPSAVPFLSAIENIELVLTLRGVPADQARAEAVAALGRVALGERAGQRVERLSAGEAQRVALARALAAARGLLIVDEPTSRLDRASAAAVARLLAAAAREDGQTVICATHDEELIAGADDVIRLG